MRKTIRRIMILLFFAFFAFTFASTNYSSPVKSLKQIFKYVDNGDQTGVEVCVNNSVHKVKTLREKVFELYSGEVISVKYVGTTYNKAKNLAAVDCIIEKRDNGIYKKIRNIFFMCYEPGLNWNLYDICGYSNIDVTDSDLETAKTYIEGLTHQNSYFDEQSGSSSILPESSDYSGKAENNYDEFTAGSYGDSTYSGYGDSGVEYSYDSYGDGSDEYLYGDYGDSGDWYSYADQGDDYDEYSNDDVAPDDEDDYDLSYSNELLDDILVRSFNYYAATEGENPQNVVVDSIDGNVVNVHIYDDMEEYMATRNWYFIDMTTLKGTDMFGNQIDLN